MNFKYREIEDDNIMLQLQFWKNKNNVNQHTHYLENTKTFQAAYI